MFETLEDSYKEERFSKRDELSNDAFGKSAARGEEVQEMHPRTVSDDARDDRELAALGIDQFQSVPSNLQRFGDEEASCNERGIPCREKTLETN